MSKAVIVFSGGQDSTTVLAKALHDGFECYAIGFDYGQKHAVELEQARIIAEALGVPYHVVNCRAFGELVSTKSALLDGTLNVNDHTPLAHMEAAIPASFVPNRNAMFLTMAHAYAQVLGADTVWTGVCETDYSGYPDCRAVFIKELESALNTGYQTDIKIVTPLMHLTKGETFKMANECGALGLVINESHTCYHGNHWNKHVWGYGCGECPACKLRAKGWDDFKAMRHIDHSGN